MLQLSIGKANYKAHHRAFTIIYPKNLSVYHENYIYLEYSQTWFVSVQNKNCNLDQRNKLHVIPRFPAGSLAVHMGSFPMRGSFAGQYKTPCFYFRFDFFSLQKKKSLLSIILSTAYFLPSNQYQVIMMVSELSTLQTIRQQQMPQPAV